MIKITEQGDKILGTYYEKNEKNKMLEILEEHLKK